MLVGINQKPTGLQGYGGCFIYGIHPFLGSPQNSIGSLRQLTFLKFLPSSPVCRVCTMCHILLLRVYIRIYIYSFIWCLGPFSWLCVLSPWCSYVKSNKSAVSLICKVLDIRICLVVSWALRVGQQRPLVPRLGTKVYGVHRLHHRDSVVHIFPLFSLESFA